MQLAEVKTQDPVRDVTEDILSLCHCDECPLKGPRVLGEGSDDYYEVFRNVPITDEEGKVVGSRQKRFLEVDRKYKYDVVFVGMAPAREELAYKRSFIGPSGKLLRSSLDSLEYCPYYMTNCCLCRFPSDFPEKSYPKAASFCKDRLFAEIRMLDPSIVVALGNLPLRILSGKEHKITKVIGKLIKGTDIGIPVIPVTHPASILRRTDGYGDFIFGLERSLDHAYGNVVVAPSPETKIVTPDNLGDFLQQLENAGEATVDLETTTRGLFPYGRNPDKIRCTGVGWEKGTTWIVPGYPSEIHGSTYTNLCQHPYFIEVLNKVDGTYHNGPFDCGFLLQAGFKPILKNDTFLMHYTTDERGKGAHGLKKLAYRYLNAPDWEADIEQWKGPNESFDNIPDDAIYRYCAHDVSYTGQLKDVLEPKMGSGAQVYRDLLIPCANMFNEIRQEGMPIDIQVLMDMDEELEQALYAMEKEIKDVCGMWVNPSSPSQIAELIYDVIGFPETADYGRSTSKDALEDYKEHYIVSKILAHRVMNKLRGSYVNNFSEFLDWDMRVHPLVKLFAAVTGRIASENPAIMNIPKKGPIKHMFLPDPGMEILEMDQSQMELRCYAVLGKDEYLTDLILEGTDPHGLVAQEALIKMGKKHLMTPAEFRTPAKTAVFGRLYGRSKKSIMHSFGLTWRDTVSLVEVIDSLFPNIGEYNQRTRQAVHLDHSLTSFFGRQRRFGLITEEARHELYRQAANFPVQSMASDINLYCMLYLYNDSEVRRNWGVHPKWPVHDAIVSFVEGRDHLGKLKKRAEEFCNDLVGSRMKFETEMEIGPNWGEMKTLTC